MSEIMMTAFLFGGLLLVLATGVWVGFSLLIVATTAMVLFTPRGFELILANMANTIWSASNKWELAALPLFIWMGEILLRSKMSEELFSGLAPWTTRLPGRLTHVNIFGCAIFAAVSGSSAATAATIGKMSLPELSKRGYPESLVIGTLAGSATLGLLIPPSIILIVFGVATEQSISRLFIAGILPGIMMVGLFLGYVMIWSMLNKDKIPAEPNEMTFMQKVKNSKSLIPVVMLIIGVIGSIYAGIASPTDAAALGAALSLVIAWFSGTLNWKMFKESLLGATITSSMIAFILMGAAFLTVAMAFTGLPRDLAAWIDSLQLSQYALIAILTIFFMVLGMFLDGISVVVLTTSVIMPMVLQAGIDPLWFGIFLVIVVEMSQITPPVGFNLFVIQGLTGRNIFNIAKAAFPFFLLLTLGVALITIFPGIATYLPEQMNR